MDDLAICKFITLLGLNERFPNAKGIKFDDTQNCFWVELVGFTSWPLLNPLTDDALCFQLMVKYKIILISVNESYGTGPIVGYNAFYKSLIDKIYLEELNPNKAILLAIIEAHNE